MKIGRRDLDWAVDQGLITRDVAQALWDGLEARASAGPRFDLTHLAWYAGALIVIFAMAWFMTEAWQRYEGVGLLALAATYGVAFTAAGRWLWNRPGDRIPGGLLIVVAVCMVPMAVFAVEWMMGLWPQPDAGGEAATDIMDAYAGFHVIASRNYVAMEVATILAALAALYFFPFPFLVMPIAVSLHYLAFDLADLLYGQEAWQAYELKLGWLTMGLGLVTLLVAYLVDRRTREDFAFWLYLYGAATFWFGLSALAVLERTEAASGLVVHGPNMHLYALVCVAMMLLSVLLQRRALIVFGALGLLGYFGWLAWEVFADSLVFPMLMTSLGLAVIWLGVQYRKHHERLHRAVLAAVPPRVARWLPASRGPRGPAGKS